MTGIIATVLIAGLNDRLRDRLTDLAYSEWPVPGKAVACERIQALPDLLRRYVAFAVNTFTDFTDEDDPSRQHRRGVLRIDPLGTVIFIIDYYGDETCDTACDDPTGTDDCYRVLTIKLL